MPLQLPPLRISGNQGQPKGKPRRETLCKCLLLSYLAAANPGRGYRPAPWERTPPNGAAFPIDGPPGWNLQTLKIMDLEIMDLVRQFPQASVTVNAADLERFGVALLQKARNEYEAEALRKVIAEKEHALLTAKEVAEYFAVSTKTVTRWRKAGYLTPVPVGGIFKYRRSDCRRILEEKGRA